MVTCDYCNKEFKYPYLLIRHYNRKTKCYINPLHNSDDSVKITKDGKITIDQSKITIDQSKITIDQSKMYYCKYCAKPSKQSSNNKTHELVCKLSKEPAIRMELKLGIDIGEYKHTQCKFCNKECKKRCHYLTHIRSCSLKKEYEIKLLGKLEDKRKVVNNYITNNDNKQVVVLNSFSNTQRILRDEPDKVLGWIMDDAKKFPSQIHKWLAPLKMIEETHSYPPSKQVGPKMYKYSMTETYGKTNTQMKYLTPYCMK